MRKLFGFFPALFISRLFQRKEKEEEKRRGQREKGSSNAGELDIKYLECLSDADALGLLNSLLHELTHYNQSWSEFTIDKFRERFSGGYNSNAQDSADQILWDQYRLIPQYLNNRKDGGCNCTK